jgi:hypothetical protein
MSYPVSSSTGYVCPADHPVPIPRVIVRVEYPVGTDSSGIALSSGKAFTAHGDFWNTWDQPALAQLTSTCLAANLDCGVDPDPFTSPRTTLVRRLAIWGLVGLTIAAVALFAGFRSSAPTERRVGHANHP